MSLVAFMGEIWLLDVPNIWAILSIIMYNKMALFNSTTIIMNTQITRITVGRRGATTSKDSNKEELSSAATPIYTLLWYSKNYFFFFFSFGLFAFIWPNSPSAVFPRWKCELLSLHSIARPLHNATIKKDVSIMCVLCFIMSLFLLLSTSKHFCQ